MSRMRIALLSSFDLDVMLSIMADAHPRGAP